VSTYKLYIDDVREPETDNDWVIARSLEEVKEVCEDKGKPSHISFDHDMGEEEPNGVEIAEWLMDNDQMPDSWNVHSANPVGSQNIKNKIKSGATKKKIRDIFHS